MNVSANKALHLTAIPLRSIAVGELGVRQPNQGEVKRDEHNRNDRKDSREGF